MTKNQRGVIKVTIDYFVVNAKRRSIRFYSSKNQPPTTNSHGKNRAAVILTVISKVQALRGHWSFHAVTWSLWQSFGHFKMQHSHCDSHSLCIRQSLWVIGSFWVIVTVIVTEVTVFWTQQLVSQFTNLLLQHRRAGDDRSRPKISFRPPTLSKKWGNQIVMWGWNLEQYYVPKIL